MAINNDLAVSGEKITSAKYNLLVADANNKVDAIHPQYLLGTTIVSGARTFINNLGVSSNGGFNIPFFHHTNFKTNYRALLRYSGSENNTISLIIKDSTETTTEATPIAATAYTASAVVLLTADFTFLKATGNYVLTLNIATSITDANSSQISGNILALPIF